MSSTYDGTEGTFITLQEAQDMIEDYENSSWFNGKTAHYFGKDKLNDILDQEDCVGLRIYYGVREVDNVDTPDLVVVGVDDSGDDMTSGYILDMSRPCPTNCPEHGIPD